MEGGGWGCLTFMPATAKAAEKGGEEVAEVNEWASRKRGERLGYIGKISWLYLICHFLIFLESY